MLREVRTVDQGISVSIRPAAADDAEGIAQVHVESWRSTYRGIISDSFLDGLTVESRARSWRWTFEHPNENEAIFVAVSNGKIIGFSNGGKNRNPEYPHGGEVYAIYLLKEYHGRGIGKRLFTAVTDSLGRSGYDSFMLWVLKDNPTLGFYQARGGRVIGEKEIEIGGSRLIELAVGWDAIP